MITTEKVDMTKKAKTGSYTVAEALYLLHAESAVLAASDQLAAERRENLIRLLARKG